VGTESAILTFEEVGAITIGRIQSASVLDAMNVDQFGKDLQDQVAKTDDINLLLDFREVEYLSSAVLTELIRVHKSCEDRGGSLRLCAMNADIHKVFEITNLDRYFTIYSDRAEEAVKKFARSLTVEADERAWSNINKSE
jgi:anti-sigma B factor antagonist